MAGITQNQLHSIDYTILLKIYCKIEKKKTPMILLLFHKLLLLFHNYCLFVKMV